MASSSGKLYEFGDWRLDPAERLLVRQGEQIALTPKVFDTLALLVENAGSLVSKGEFMERVWPDAFVEDAVLTQNISQLRKVLGDPGAIETVPKKGYRFLKPVRALGAAEGATFPPTKGWSSEVEPPVAPAEGRHRKSRSVVLGSAMALVVTVTLMAIMFRDRHMFMGKPKPLGETDTIVLASFSNKTGDPAFDDALQQALSIALAQSPFLNVVSDHKVRQTLNLMGRPEEEIVTGEIALEVCQRTASRVVLQGSIASFGNQYVIGLDVRNCQTGDLLAVEQVKAARKEDVLDALGMASAHLRGKLGESLSSVQKFDVPLESATTPSLEALKAYSIALKIRNTRGNAEAIPFFKHAIELDPNFALAYGTLSSTYQMEFESDLSQEYAKKAYARRERVTEREKFALTTFYFNFVTGEREKAMENCTLWVQAYPRDAFPHICLFFSRENIGRYDEALPYGLDCIRVSPDTGPCYADLVMTYRVLNRASDGKAIYQQALSRGIDRPDMHKERYYIAFVENDAAEMARQAEAVSGKDRAEDTMLSVQADTEAYFGRLAKARELARRAAQAAASSDQAERVAMWQLDAALREALLGNTDRARQQADAALKTSSSKFSRRMAAIVLALAGDSNRAEVLNRKLMENYPADTMQVNYWKPLTAAAIQLTSKKPDAALEELNSTTSNEMGDRLPLFSAYLRGQAYLALHRGPEAAVAFQKIVDHPGLVTNRLYGALARLGIARGNAMQSETAKARSSYQDFFTLWKDADPDVPILQHAKAEYAKLQAGESRRQTSGLGERRLDLILARINHG